MTQIRTIIIISSITFTGLFSGIAYAQNANVPPQGNAGACFIQYTSPAVIETVTEQVLLQAEKRAVDVQTGQSVVISPAIYRTDTVQKIISPRRAAQIEIICQKDQSVGFTQTLQRALTARGHYRGAITGLMDQRTKNAVRRVQKSHGVNIADVTVELAESYGLIIHRLFTQ